ncbi:NAD(P)-dependent oxidoreductase [Stappia sp.]|uniref:NAD(P)-dependent oxidoreductase n=1 Tax=Stappia sp. TaxID=1870903 RepID=UPI003A99835B
MNKSPLPLVVMTNVVFPETVALFEGVARVVVNDRPEPWPADVMREHCREAVGLMAFMTDRIDGAFLDGCPRLRVVGAALKGFDNIDVEAATRRGVQVTICEDLLTAPSAELAIGLMLSLGRHMLPGDAGIRDAGFGGWRPVHYGVGLADAEVGIVGFGRVGQAIAERLAGFGCRISAFDASPGAFPERFDASVARRGLPELLENSDFVVLALPLTPTTLHLIDASAISTMKTGALLINPARGSLVDEQAVADALEGGKLAGYAADVFECEDWARPDRPDCVNPRLRERTASTVLTPHLGSAVTRVRREIEASAARSIIDVLSGRQPAGAINVPADTGNGPDTEMRRTS